MGYLNTFLRTYLSDLDSTTEEVTIQRICIAKGSM